MFHHQVYSRAVDTGEKSTWKPRRIPNEYQRSQAMLSNTGGMGYCADCKHRFSMDYMTWVYRKPLTAAETVCRDCQGTHHYPKA